MRFDQRRRPNKKASSARPRRAVRRKPGMLELLERREMLAADAPSPWQNPLNRYDVNFDQRISPSDLLAIVNDLSRNGTHLVEGVAPLSADGSRPRYLDVNGDHRISPMDMLIVINELADEEVMTVRTIVTDLSDNPITSIPVGSQFKVRTIVQDVRTEAEFQGVFAAGADIAYNAGLSSHDPGQAVAYNAFFPLIRQSDLSTQGRIIAYASSDSGSAPGNSPQFLFSVILTADAPGLQTFTPMFDANPFHEYLVYGDFDALTADDIQFIGTSLEITEGAALSIGDVSQSETNADTTFQFTVTLSSAQSEQVTVAFNTVNGTATTADNDYTATSGTLTFAVGQTMAVIPVTVKGDTNVEPNETFTVVLSNPSGSVSLNKSTGVGTIINDDVLAELSIAGSTVMNVEVGTTTANFTVSVAQPVTSPVTVQYATANGTAIAGTDYQATSGTLTFNPGGGLTQVVPVTIIGDPNPDDADEFFVNLSNPINAQIVNGQAVIRIEPAVSAATVSVSDVSKFEGDAGQTPFVFTISLSQASNQPAVVEYFTADGSATTADNDYVAVPTQSITFAPGVTSLPVTVQVQGDTVVEPSETFLVNVRAVSGASGEDQGVGTIVDDDGPPALTISDTTVTAGADVTMAIFTVTLSGKLNQAVSVSFASSDNTAVAGVDYEAVTGILTFTPGGPAVQTIPVTIRRSSTPQPDKSFFVSLSSPTGGVSIDDELGVGTIITQGISISNAVVVEGNTGSQTAAVFTVTLSRMLTTDVTVVYTTADGTATAGSDYTATSGTITFSGDTQTALVTVMVTGDDVQEGNETFSVNLSNAVGAPIFSPTGTGTILDNDGFTVNYRLELTDTNGVPLPADATLEVDDEFLLRVFVRDVQINPTGVAQAFLDIAYQQNLAMPTGSPTFGPFLSMFATGRFEPGLLDDFGAFGQNTPPPDPAAEQLLFSLPFRAIDVGLLNFTSSLENLDIGHETFVYLSQNTEPVPIDEITLENESINIGSNVLTVSDAQVTEGGNMVFTVTRFLPENTLATVVYSTSNGTAIAGQDYTPVSGTLTFLPGDTTPQTIVVPTTNDTTDENDETFSLVLSMPTGATISGLPIGTGTILNDDGPPSVSVGNGSGAEGANVVFTVSLAAVSGKTVTVAYTTTPTGTATPGVDYTPVSGTLTFLPGVTQQTVAVPALTDILLEGNESFQLVLSNPSNAVLGNATGNGTIVDVPPAGISGFVYVDANGNGIKDAGEKGIAGATITATRTQDGTTHTTTTGADGSYLFTGLVPGTYTLVETQPGFYSDGRDTRFGVDSAFNDRFVGIALAPSAAESGFNFGETGIRSDFIAKFFNRQALFSSAASTNVFGPQLNMPGAVLDLRTGDIFVSFDGGWDGLRQFDALFNSAQGSVFMRLYNNALQEIAVSAPTATGSVLIHNGTPGQTYFLRIWGSNPNVQIQMSQPALPSSLSEPQGAGDSNPPADNSGTSQTPSTPSSSWRFASALVMTEPESEPLAGTDSTDDALAEEDDWLLSSVLS